MFNVRRGTAKLGNASKRASHSHGQARRVEEAISLSSSETVPSDEPVQQSSSDSMHPIYPVPQTSPMKVFDQPVNQSSSDGLRPIEDVSPYLQTSSDKTTATRVGHLSSNSTRSAIPFNQPSSTGIQAVKPGLPYPETSPIKEALNARQTGEEINTFSDTSDYLPAPAVDRTESEAESEAEPGSEGSFEIPPQRYRTVPAVYIDETDNEAEAEANPGREASFEESVDDAEGAGISAWLAASSLLAHDDACSSFESSITDEQWANFPRCCGPGPLDPNLVNQFPHRHDFGDEKAKVSSAGTSRCGDINHDESEPEEKASPPEPSKPKKRKKRKSIVMPRKKRSAKAKKVEDKAVEEEADAT